MGSFIHQPHDRFFKCSLTEKKIAIDFLKTYLPTEIYKRIDLATLELTDKSFILPKLREIHSDIIYRCQLDGKASYVFFLVEHESTARDELMAFRKLQYTIGAMEQHVRQGNKKLPIVLPICLYHGKQSPYPHPIDVYDCFEDPVLARQLAFKPFRLI